MTLGPFDMTIERIESLGIRFTEFVNRLLAVEQAASRSAGHLLTISNIDTVADGGVDAATRNAEATDWMPAGKTAWQFKRGDLEPAECDKELRGATWAHEFLRDGGSYILVLGKGLTDDRIHRRCQGLLAVAIELGLLAADDLDRILVYDGNKLTRWVSKYPSLAVSRLANGPGTVAIDFASWANKAPHQRVWTPDPKRETAIESLRARVGAQGAVDIRVQGDSGIGKTRLVLEALRSEGLSPLVAYVDDPAALSGELLEHLVDDRRTAILVVDECPADRHAKLSDRLPAGTSIKLVTIGHGGPAITPTPIVGVEAMPIDIVEAFVQANFPGMSPEARRFVAVHSRGNMRWTIVLAERVGQTDAVQAADLIRRDDITAFITTVLPEGRDFFCSAVLALCDRVGWDRELQYQMRIFAEFAGRSFEEMEEVGRNLEQRGLMVRHGRLRSIEPHPLAVFLAAEAWRREGRRIVDELLPKLDESMALALFERVADLGRFEPARSVLPALLSGAGPLASLRGVEEASLGRLLTQLAIVLPDEVAMHLGEQIEAEPLDELRGYTRSRRDLVWTLEKLAWHRRTFEVAAHALLRLALAETESYANNATGTWISLFGTMLPGTAATPEQRAMYLAGVARDPDPGIRQLAVKACEHTFAHHEMITVSAELQGGVLVEPRGAPATREEAFAYRNRAVEVLEELTGDADAEVAKAAVEALIGSLHALLDDPLGGARLIDALGRLEGTARVRVRTEADRLLRIYDRRKTEDVPEVKRLEGLIETLPPADTQERIQILAGMQRWDMGEGELQSELDDLVATLAPTDVAAVVTLLDSEVPAAWELGHALARRPAVESDEVLRSIVSKLDSNPAAMPGFLSSRVESGDGDAFDEFLASEVAGGLDDRARVFIAVRGPVTTRARELIMAALHRLPISISTSLLFGWQRNLDDQDVVELFDDWLSRLSAQVDYNSLVGWVSLWIHGQNAIPDALRVRVLRLLLLRKEYPSLSQQRWDWARVADGFIDSHGMELATIILDGVDSGVSMIHQGDEDSRLLIAAAGRRPGELWNDVAHRLGKGSWRIQMELSGWLLAAIPTDVMENWIGTDVERGRIVAAIAPVGVDSPTPLARYLLETFGKDRKVASSLSVNFIAGFWSGQESAHVAKQIEQLNGWRRQKAEPLAVREWASDMVESLEQRLVQAQQREAEEPS